MNTSDKERQKKLQQYKQVLSEYPTEAERKFGLLLKSVWVRYMFQKSFYANGFSCIVDYYIPELKLCIEIDGSAHSIPKQILRDQNKENYLVKMRNFNLLRISNYKVHLLYKDYPYFNEFWKRIDSIFKGKRQKKLYIDNNSFLYL